MLKPDLSQAELIDLRIKLALRLGAKWRWSKPSESGYSYPILTFGCPELAEITESFDDVAVFDVPTYEKDRDALVEARAKMTDVQTVEFIDNLKSILDAHSPRYRDVIKLIDASPAKQLQAMVMAIEKYPA